MKEALAPAHMVMMVPRRGGTSMTVMTGAPKREREGLRRVSPSDHGISQRQRASWTYLPGPKITGKLIDIYV